MGTLPRPLRNIGELDELELDFEEDIEMSMSETFLNEDGVPVFRNCTQRVRRVRNPYWGVFSLFRVSLI